jgi:acetyl esterase/lipase
LYHGAGDRPGASRPLTGDPNGGWRRIRLAGYLAGHLQDGKTLSARIAIQAWALALGAMLLAAAPTATADVRLMDWPDLLGRPMPQPTQRIAYGPRPDGVVELWLPKGEGPFPVVLMIHGGCWVSAIANLTIMNYAAEDLRTRGIAVWNIEYRGVDRPGGGYPGTFGDVAAAADLLGRQGARYRLRTDRVVALGHSAGGHLALWLAARGRIAAASPLRAAYPLRIAAVVSLGGLPDLQLEHDQGICGARNIEALVGPPRPGHADVYADTSPAELGAGPDREVLISGAEDPIAPPDLAGAYAAKMKGKGADIRTITVPDTGHVELISPGSAAWSRTVGIVDGLVHSR